MTEAVHTHPVDQALDQFIQRQQQLQPESPQVPLDSQWPSPCCLVEGADGELSPWRPVRQQQTCDMFARLSEALEEPVHPSVISFYSRYWSDPLPARSEEGQLSLLQVWNSDDMERLRGNLIGHALAKRKQRQPLSLFFATTEPDGNYFLSVMNSDGTIWLEQPGKKPIRQLADSLAEFINRLEPERIQDME
ncbi:MAG: SecY-interacting protein [Marinobacterium sp.]|nr:SecY-interacting protein [Marinobacterium sp.]